MTVSFPALRNVLAFGLPIAGFLIGMRLPVKSFDEASSELMSLFGLIMAGVLPTMVLAAGVLRAGNLTQARLIALSEALNIQMKVWIGLFFICLIASFALIVGKAASWDITLGKLITEPTWAASFVMKWNLAQVLQGIISYSLVLLAMKSLELARGVMSLLSVSSEIALSEARARDALNLEEVMPRDGFVSPTGFGELIPTPTH